MDLGADEVLTTVRELFPREYDIVLLATANRRQAEHIALLESEKPATTAAEPAKSN